MYWQAKDPALKMVQSMLIMLIAPTTQRRVLASERKQIPHTIAKKKSKSWIYIAASQSSTESTPMKTGKPNNDAQKRATGSIRCDGCVVDERSGEMCIPA